MKKPSIAGRLGVGHAREWPDDAANFQCVVTKYVR